MVSVGKAGKKTSFGEIARVATRPEFSGTSRIMGDLDFSQPRRSVIDALRLRKLR